MNHILSPKKRFVIFLITFILVLLKPYVSFSQEESITFSGFVRDSKGAGLEGANITLYPTDKSKSPSFGVSENSGTFKIKIIEKTEYLLNITFIGFIPIKETLTSSKTDITKEFILIDSPEELEEVDINYTPPIVIKKDTTTFQTDAFTNGKERKLGAVLKRLPGVSVNRDGDVFFKNKKVEAVLVENKTFFTGQPKMATQNIPADVVSEVQMIEDYNETAFLKDFQNSDNLVMNIKLKEGKKKFIFGDIESGLGYKDRYKLHPSIFRYSPTTVYNFIGDINNTQSRSFSLSDFFKIEGDNDLESIMDNLNSPTAKFLQNEDYYKNKHVFGGYNFQYNPDSKNEIRVFILGMMDKSFRQNTLNYIYQPSQASENRLNEQNDRNALLLGKIKYKFIPDIYTVLKLDLSYNKSQLNNRAANISESQGLSNKYNKINSFDSNRVQMKIAADKWFSSRNVSTAKINLLFNEEKLDDSWESISNIFTPKLPLVPSSFYSVSDIGHRKYTDFNFDLKHHFRPIRTGMITFGLYGQILKSNLQGLSSQLMDENIKINLSGFKNDFRSLLTEINNSLTYKWYINKNLIFETGVVAQNVYWKDINLSSNKRYSKSNILPVGRIEWNFKENKSITLSYNSSAVNSNSRLRLAGHDMEDFNRVLIGNPYLTQIVKDRAIFSVSLHKTYGLSFYSKLGYRNQINPIVQASSFDGINGSVSPLQLNHNINSYDLVFRTKYNRRYWNLSLENSIYQNEGISVFDGLEMSDQSLNIINTLRGNTDFENLPNVEIEIKSSFMEYTNPLFNNITHSTDMDFSLVYDYKQWKFDFSAFQNFYNNRIQNNQSYFNQLEAKIFYHKEDSPIEIGIYIYNLGNNRRQISNQYNSIYFAENIKKLFPRTIMIQLNYKL